MSDLDDVKRKVRALLAMAAEGSGATDAERKTAKELADRLSEKHGLHKFPRPITPATFDSRMDFNFIREYMRRSATTTTTTTNNDFIVGLASMNIIIDDLMT